MSVTPDNRILTGAIVPTFFYFVIPSITALLALTTANLVDGLFVGNFVGAQALAAINFLIPYLAIVFGLALMVAIGGSVRAGKFLGEKNNRAASAIFSKSIIAVFFFALFMMLFNLLFDRWIFVLLGAPPELFALMRSYFHVVSLFLPAQLLSVVLYYFIRADGKPVTATVALTCGALSNMLMDALFVGYLHWGMAGAAWATGVSQLLQLVILLSYFYSANRVLNFRLWQQEWSEVFHAAFNGVSEFINEISGGLVILLINWLLMTRIGLDGVAAFTVINYFLFASLMIFYGIADAMQLLVAQNYGARNIQRMRQFLQISSAVIFAVGVAFVVALLVWHEPLIHGFLSDKEAAVIEMASTFILLLWPLFIVNGLNVLLSSYLTAIHKPSASATVALLRSLALPILFLCVISFWFPDRSPLVALPMAEWLTFFVALILCWRLRPARLFS